MPFDLAIVGGGPAGLATALFAAQRGLSAVVVEKRRPPLDKACGEGLMPPGMALAREMGLEVGHYPFTGIRYCDATSEAEASFPSEPGWGIRRTALIDSMIRRARELSVELRYGLSAGGWSLESGGQVRLQTEETSLQARYLIGADGLHSRIRRQLGLATHSRGPRRYGVRRHFKIAPWSPRVEVHWVEGTEAYVTPVATDEVGVAILWSGEPARFESLLARFPRLRDRLASCEATSSARGAGPFRQKVRRRYRGRVALVGDAAGFLDALTGEGLSLAFGCAKALVEAIADERGLAAYEKAYRRLSRPYYFMTELLLWVAARPRLRQRVLATLASEPSLFDRLLAVSTGERPFHAIGLNGVFQLMAGITKPL